MSSKEKQKSFHERVKEWLEPLGYAIIFSTNHPTFEKNEIHYIKDGIRVICMLESGEESCHLHKDILDKRISVGLKSGRHEVGFEYLDDQIEVFKEIIKSIEVDISSDDRVTVLSELVKRMGTDAYETLFAKYYTAEQARKEVEGKFLLLSMENVALQGFKTELTKELMDYGKLKKYRMLRWVFKMLLKKRSEEPLTQE